MASKISLSLLLLLSWLTMSGAQRGGQSPSLWSLLRKQYGGRNGTYIAYSLQVWIYRNREDQLRRRVEQMQSSGQLRNLCRYVTAESCRVSSSGPGSAGGQQSSVFLYIVQTLTRECCTAVAPVADGIWGEWGRWSGCSVTCGQGSRSRKRQCDHPPPSSGGRFCLGYGQQFARCPVIPCPTAPVAQGMWGQWGRWSGCSVTCGQGTRSRTRRCDHPPPSPGGRYCVGHSAQSMQCPVVLPCPTVSPVAQGMWGEWGRWSGCSATCGQGTRSRTRRCDHPPPSPGGRFCVGYSVQSMQCPVVLPCPTVSPVVQGMWGQWGRWSGCSVTCGQGTRSRSRRCDHPPPSPGGQFCVGYGVQVNRCQSASCTASRQCSRTMYGPGGRVMGGSAAMVGQYPWLVHLVVQGSIRCAGVIVDTLTILTAGHCLAGRIDPQTHRLNSTDVEIVAGNYRRSVTPLEAGAQRVSVVSGLRHYNYDPLYLKNDVTVLRLAQPLKFNNVVSNVCLPSKTDTLPPTCVVAGWGALSYSNNFPQELQHVTLQVYDYQQCRAVFDKTTPYDINRFLSAGVMCAANGTSGGKDSCRGDSGSGLMCVANDAEGAFYKLFGLVSSGFGCGARGQPGYYAYLPYYMDWITKTIDLLKRS